MSDTIKIHADKTPNRIHYIPEWAERRNLRQSEIVALTGADKGLVSRWFKGVLPKQNYLETLAGIFEVEVAALFRHPDDDWLSSFFKNKSSAEREKALQMLRIMFDEKKPANGTDG